MAKHRKSDFDSKQVFELLKSPAVDDLQTALNVIGDFVRRNYDPDEENDPLAGIFNLEPEEDKILDLPLLDEALIRNIENLPDKSLVTTFGFTLQNVYHNYRAALLVSEELIRRRDAKTELAVMKLFIKACEMYEPGHRYYMDTVFDALVTEYFPRFESEALYHLLSTVSHDSLKNDELDHLFEPALLDTSNEKLQVKIIKVLFAYRSAYLPYFDFAYFDNLVETIIKKAPPELRALINENLAKASEQDRIIKIMEHPGENLDEVISLLPGLEDDVFRVFRDRLMEAFYKGPISDVQLQNVLNALEQRSKYKLVAELLYRRWHLSEQQDRIIRYCEQVVDKEQAIEILQLVIRTALKNGHDRESLRDYREVLEKKFAVPASEILKEDIKSLISLYLEAASDEELYFRNLERVVKAINGDLTIGGFFLTDILWNCVEDDEFEKPKNLYELAYGKISDFKDQMCLSLITVSAIRLKDEKIFVRILEHAKQLEEIEEELLAFNLACGAAVFGLKDELLTYSKKAIDLGKSADEFLDDEDFTPYLEDEAFLEAIHN